MEIAITELFGIRNNIIVPNISWGFGIHECDLLIVRKTGIAIEIEIKKTKQDFLNDFKKLHNHVDTEHRIAEFYYALPEHLYDVCSEYIKPTHGIILCYVTKNYKGEFIVKAKIKRTAKKIKKYRKLTIDEQFKIAKLGTMRILSLKKKILKYGKNNKK